MCIKLRFDTTNEKEEKIRKSIVSDQALIAEYEAAQDFALQADSIAWQFGSILIGGVILTYGLLTDKTIEPVFFYGGILLINLVLSFWILFYEGQYQVKLMKLYRVREIEEELKLKQNLFWEKGRSGKQKGIYRTYGPGGNFLKKLLFITLSSLTVLQGAYKLVTCFYEYEVWTRTFSTAILSLALIISIVAFVVCQCKENDFKSYIKTYPGK